MGTELKPSAKRWGIVIGVDTYHSEKIHNLHGCVNDAKAMAELMLDADCGNFSDDHLAILENPGFDLIEDAFSQICGRIQDGDELWVYFAGHGYSEARRTGKFGYLLPADTCLENGILKTRTCISQAFLRDDLILRNINKRNITVVLFLDCCCAASMFLSSGDRALPDINLCRQNFDSAFRDLVPGRSEEHGGVRYITFAATGTSETAREDENGGIFTRHLVEGLSGLAHDPQNVRPSDYCVRTGELGAFLYDRVPGQTPNQDFKDPSYPLTVAKGKKQKLEREKQLDEEVRAWLISLLKQRLISTKEYDFAVKTMTESPSQRRDDTLCRLLRTFGHHEFFEPDNAAAGAIRAFYAFSIRQDNATPSNADTKKKATSQGATAYGRPAAATANPLSAREFDELDAVLKRLCPRCRKLGIHVSGEDDFDLATATGADAADYVNRLAREWCRHACAAGDEYHALFSKDFRDKWRLRAKEGALSFAENAIYELVLDDKALKRDNR